MFPLISVRWLICDSLFFCLDSVVIYPGFDNSMKHIKHITNRASPPLWVSGLWTQRHSLCVNSTECKKKSFSQQKGKQHCFFIIAPDLSDWNQTVLLMNVAAESFLFSSFKKGSSSPWFSVCGKRGRGMHEPNNYLPFITFWGEGELKGLFRKLCRQKAESEPQLFVDQWICSSWSLPAMVQTTDELAIQRSL